MTSVSVGLSCEELIRVMKAGRCCCKLPSKTAEEGEEEFKEVTAGKAVEVYVVCTIFFFFFKSEMDDILTFQEETFPSPCFGFTGFL